MDRRNWLQLTRKLIDRSDLDYTVNAIQSYMAQNNLAFYGEGVLITTTYPVPFPVSLVGSTMTGTVGKGIAYDPTGLQVRIDDTLGAFTITPGDSANARKDLLVLRYQAVGQEQIPEPSLPTASVYLNLVDGYTLAVIAGAPSVSPSYPTKGQYDIILAGLNVAAGATTVAGVTVDLSIREIALPLRAFFPSFVQEVPAGAVDSSNQAFALSQLPYNAQSVLVSVDGLRLTSSDWSLSGQTLTLNQAPDPGQNVYVWYVVNSYSSVNPLSGQQETPTGTINGTNAVFTLAGQPVSQAVTQVYVDGLELPATEWSLQQNATTSAIVFGFDSIPVAGQTVYVSYLKNASPYSQAAYGGTGSGSTIAPTEKVEYPVLTAGNITDGFVALSQLPVEPSNVLLDVIGSGAKIYGTDYTVSGQVLTFTSTQAAGDTFRVQYYY